METAVILRLWWFSHNSLLCSWKVAGFPSQKWWWKCHNLEEKTSSNLQKSFLCSLEAFFWLVWKQISCDTVKIKPMGWLFTPVVSSVATWLPRTIDTCGSIVETKIFFLKNITNYDLYMNSPSCVAGLNACFISGLSALLPHFKVIWHSFISFLAVWLNFCLS